MWMELQGKKTTHDFLSLCNDSSSFQRHHDPRPPPPPPPAPSQQGIKTHDFFGGGGGRGAGAGEAQAACPRAAPDINLPATASAAEHVLPLPPGGVIITYASTSHVHGFPSTVAVKPEWPTSPVAAWPPQQTATPITSTASASARRVGAGPASQSSRTTTFGNMGHHHSGGRAFTLWEEPPLSREPKGISKGESVAQQQQGWPSSSYGSRSGNSSFPSLSPSRNQKCLVMDSASKSSKGYTDDEDDEDYSLKGEGYLHKDYVGLAVNVEGKGTGDQKPSTPRSKHSATEQRRRSKINDRFQILRKLIPHSDQKRDKASFLLEVIEYIQFLQEKVHKYESTYPMWNHENTNMMPWVKVFFRSLWENARKNTQCHFEGIADPSRVIGDDQSPNYVVCGDTIEASAPVGLGCNQVQTVSENVTSGLSNKTIIAPVHLSPCGTSDSFNLRQHRLVSESDNITYQSQSHCMKTNSVPGNDRLDGQELTIDEGTISISSAYSQGVLQSLTEALQSSGIDLSLASISVEINLGKQAFGRPGSCSKSQEDPPFLNQAIGPLRVGSSCQEESQHVNKRQKLDKC